MPHSCRSYTFPPTNSLKHPSEPNSLTLKMEEACSPIFSGQTCDPADVTTCMAISCSKSGYLVEFFIFMCSWRHWNMWYILIPLLRLSFAGRTAQGKLFVLRPSPFWDLTQHSLLVGYQRSETAYWSHLQGSRVILLGLLGPWRWDW